MLAGLLVSVTIFDIGVFEYYNETIRALQLKHFWVGLSKGSVYGAMVAYAGTRDKDCVPHLHRVSGWLIEPNQATIACSIPEGFTNSLIDSLENNGQFALTVEQIGSHETYQFKGDHVDSRPCDETDIVTFERYRERFGNFVSSRMGLSKEACYAYFIEPSIVIRFKVHEIFLQTPGPGAGQRLVPPEEK